MNEINWVTQANFPLLGTLQLLPLAGCVMVWLMRTSRLLFQASILIAAAELVLAVYLFQQYDHTLASFQLAERIELATPLSYHAAVDGISVLFILLTALLTLIIMFYVPVRELRPLDQILATTFAVEAAMMGMFSTVDLLWFVILSFVYLGLVGFLLLRWGTSSEKGKAITRYFQFMGSGLLLLVIGTAMLGWQYADASGGHWSFNLFELMKVPVSGAMQTWIFFLLFYGLAIRIPLFPLHGWFPLTAEHGNIAVAPVFLLGVKTGVYGLLRFVFPLLPDAVLQWHKFVVAFAVAGVFYAALLAMMQVDLRRLLAFAVVSHTSILVIGLFSLNHHAFQGSVILSVNFGLAASGLLLMTGLVYRRTNTTRLNQMGSLFDRIPFIGITFFVAGLSIVGMPGTPGFDAVHLVLEAAIARFGAVVTVAAAIGNVLAAGFLLWAFQKAFLAPRKDTESVWDIEPTSKKEFFIAGAVMLILIGTGFYIEPWLELIENSIGVMSTPFHVQGDFEDIITQ
jgi:NADH-quinone oxidoreductase subunit M